MEYFCSGNTVAILLCQNTFVSNMFVSLLVPVCFSVTSRLIGNADDLPPLYFQYFSHQVVQYFQKNEELQVLNSGRQTTTTSSPASTPGFTYRSTNTMDGMHPDR